NPRRSGQDFLRVYSKLPGGPLSHKVVVDVPALPIAAISVSGIAHNGTRSAGPHESHRSGHARCLDLIRGKQPRRCCGKVTENDRQVVSLRLEPAANRASPESRRRGDAGLSILLPVLNHAELSSS